MWEGNVPRQHAVEKVFSCDGSGMEVMMYGTVTLNLPKEDVVLPWAGHMTLDDKNGTLRVRDYHVYVCGIVCLGQSDETGQHASIRSASPSISGPCRCQLRVNNIIYSWINPFRRLIP
jgi:hypothetical protein